MHAVGKPIKINYSGFGKQGHAIEKG